MEDWIIEIEVTTSDEFDREDIIVFTEERLNRLMGIDAYSFSVKKAPRPPEPDKKEYCRERKNIIQSIIDNP